MKTMHMKRALLVVWGVALAGLGLSACGGVEALDGGAPEPLGSIEQRACDLSPSVSWASGSPSCPPPPTCTECDPASSCQVSSSLVSCGTQPSAQAFQSCDGWCIARDACGSNFQICPYP
jgi:hypothetical protein